MASCNQIQGFDTVDSSGTSNITTSSGLLDVIVNASPSGTSSAAFNEVLTVTGGTGSGTLVANFTVYSRPHELAIHLLHTVYFRNTH